MRTWRRRQEGFTLLEVLAAVTILSVVSLAMTAFFIQAMGYAKGNENKTVAVNLARNALFFAEKQRYDDFKIYFEKAEYTEINENGAAKQYKELTIAGCGLNAVNEVDCKGVNANLKSALFKNTDNLWETMNPSVNNVPYKIELRLDPSLINDKAGLEKYLLPIRVTAVPKSETNAERNSARVEGYIADEKIR